MVQAVNPYWAAHVVRVVTKFTISAHGRSSGQAVFDVSSSQSETEHYTTKSRASHSLSPVVTELPQRLDGEALAACALVHVAQLAGAHLAFLLAGANPDKHSAIKVDTQAQQRLNVPPVPESEWSTEKERNSPFSPVGVRLETLQQNPDSKLVTGLGLEGDGPVLGVASLGTVPAQHGHVSGGDTEEAALRDRLHGPVQERSGAAVRIEVNHIKSLFRRLVLVHQERCVAIMGLHQVPDIVVLGVPLDALHRLA